MTIMEMVIGMHNVYPDIDHAGDCE